MATAFSAAPTMPHHAPAPYQHHAYRKSIQYSPTGAAITTPTTPVSPPSPATPQLPLARHQGIYQPRTAIGIPAALRKTEKPGSKSPPQVDSGVGSPNSGWNVNGGFSAGASNGHATPIGSQDLQSLYHPVPLSPVAGPITRNHWQEPFSFFQRRHHCRKCGGIYCWQHSASQVRLDELARFHPDGGWYRACDRCYSSFREWEHLRTSRNNSDSSARGGAPVQSIETPAPAKRPENQRVGSLAQSLQGAWNWSTF